MANMIFLCGCRVRETFLGSLSSGRCGALDNGAGGHILKRKFMVFMSCKFPVLCYGYGTWTPKVTHVTWAFRESLGSSEVNLVIDSMIPRQSRPTDHVHTNLPSQSASQFPPEPPPPTHVDTTTQTKKRAV